MTLDGEGLRARRAPACRAPTFPGSTQKISGRLLKKPCSGSSQPFFQRERSRKSLIFIWVRKKVAVPEGSLRGTPKPFFSILLGTQHAVPTRFAEGWRIYETSYVVAES